MCAQFYGYISLAEEKMWSSTVVRGPVTFGNLHLHLNEKEYLKAKKTHGFKSYIVISVYTLDIPSIKKTTEYHNK